MEKCKLLCFVVDGKRIIRKNKNILIPHPFRDYSDISKFKYQDSSNWVKRYVELASLMKNFKKYEIIALINPNNKEVYLGEIIKCEVFHEIQKTQYCFKIEYKFIGINSRIKDFKRIDSLYFKYENKIDIFSDKKIFKYLNDININNSHHNNPKKKPSYVALLDTGYSERRLKGTIVGHGNMNRKNLEASYIRTEEYLKKLDRESQKRINKNINKIDM